jgi:hypothetical protein
MSLRSDLRIVVVAAVTAAVTAGGPAVAEAVVDLARNADKVDGKHAVGAAASVRARRGRLVATNPQTGRLPNNIIATAPNADKLDGKDSSRFATKTWLGTPGAINLPSNPVHWSRLAGVPSEIADGADDIGPGAFAHVSNAGIPLDSRAVTDVSMPDADKGVYCFDVSFAPDVVLVTPDLKSSASVRTAGAQAFAAVSSDVLSSYSCPPESDAVVAFRNATDTELPRAYFFVTFS